jgi:uncharacterized spore protein YtfJ
MNLGRVGGPKIERGIEREKTMTLNRLFDLVGEIQEKAAVEAVFGPPTEVEGKIIIPIGQVAYGFGLAGAATAPASEAAEPSESAEEGVPSGGGGGGGLTVQPLAVLEVTPEATTLQPIVDEGKIARTAILAGAWIVFWLARAAIKVFGKR